jgi:ubiquinone/menaquinone biosynthesis C-methylase UbiE
MRTENTSASFYSRRILSFYDQAVHGFSNRFAWNCPTELLTGNYNKYISCNHLEVGAGTGFFLDKCRFPCPNPRLALMDLNNECLIFAARRIERYRPFTICHDILKPPALDLPLFDSIGLTYVLHCIQGSFPEKGLVFKHLKRLMNPQGVLFGATILPEETEPNLLARQLMRIYNARHIFNNAGDSFDGLEHILKQTFRYFNLVRKGCAGIFAASDRPITIPWSE